MSLLLIDPTLVCPQASTWPDLIKTGASVMALPLAGFTFWLGFRQKEKERLSSYYHKAVIDVALPLILKTFGEEIDRLQESGRLALEGMKSTRKTLPRSCSAALSEFADNLFALQDSIAERTVIFDDKLTEEIRIEFEETQDTITDWFNDITLHKRRELTEIVQLLRLRQRKIVRRLYKGGVADFAKAE